MQRPTRETRNALGVGARLNGGLSPKTNAYERRKRMEIKEIRNELVKYSATDAAIAEMSKNYLALTIKDINDQEEYKLVHSARMDVKSKRVAVKKRDAGTSW